MYDANNAVHNFTFLSCTQKGLLTRGKVLKAVTI